jgi:PhzF family phenazine biosynthesis protein
MNFEVNILNAFTYNKKGGNGAGVLYLKEKINEDIMQKIATEVNLSETVFIAASDDPSIDFDVRFFTPTNEVDLCGHGTLAAFGYLKQEQMIDNGSYRQQTKAGMLRIDVTDDVVYMEQALPTYGKTLDKIEIADSLNIKRINLSDNLPVQLVSTGLRDILVPVKSPEILEEIQPDFEKIKKISKQNDAVGYHVFSLKTKEEFTASCRNFAPLVGIDEESATGTSNGALACYLQKYLKGESTYVFQQGFNMNQPSKIIVKLEKDENHEITQVLVGGTVVQQETMAIAIE